MPAVLGIAAEAMNMTTGEFLDAMEQGQIRAKEFLPVFTEALKAEAKPGLAKALETTNVALKRAMQNGKMLIKAIFEAGIGDLFAQIFNMLSDIFRILEPVLSLLVSFGTTVFKVLIFPLRLAIAIIRDLISLLDYALGGQLNNVMSTIGTVLGYLYTMVTQIFKGINKLFGWLFGKMPSMRVGRSVGDRIAESARQGSEFAKATQEYGGVAKNVAKTAGGYANQYARSRAATASAAGELGSSQVIPTVKANVEFSGEGKEMLRENRNDKSRQSMKNNTRG